MRLAIVETASHGGLLHYAVQLGDGLAARGHQVDLLLARENELSGRAGPAGRREVLVAPVRSTREPPTGIVRTARRALVAARLVRNWTRVLRDSSRRRYDAVFLGDLRPVVAGGAALALTARPRRPAVVAVAHNVRPFTAHGGDEYLADPVPMLARVYPRLDLVLVHGERSRQELEEIWPDVRVRTIPHGDERVFADEEPVPATGEGLLFFGNWQRQKGLPVLMDAFDRLAARRPAARLTIAGRPWEDAADVRAWAARHGDRVRVVDSYVAMEDVPALFAEALVVVTPYLAAYQSGVVHLAMTMGRAVVSSDVGDLRDAVLDGQTGRLVPPGDADALAAALEELLADPDTARRMGAEGRRRAGEESSWEAVAEQVEQHLRDLPGLPSD